MINKVITIWNKISLDLLTGVILIIVSTIFTVIVIDRVKVYKRKKRMLTLLKTQISLYVEPVKTEGVKRMQMGLNQVYILEILHSEVLNYTKDYKLINALHNLSCGIDNFNQTNNLANDNMIGNDEAYNFYSEQRDDVYQICDMYRNEILEILDGSYTLYDN